MAFQIASTNLVFEIGIVMWLLLGWRFTLAELVGGLVMIGFVGIAIRLVVSDEAVARAQQQADCGVQVPWRVTPRWTCRSTTDGRGGGASPARRGSRPSRTSS